MTETARTRLPASSHAGRPERAVARNAGGSLRSVWVVDLASGRVVRRPAPLSDEAEEQVDS